MFMDRTLKGLAVVLLVFTVTGFAAAQQPTKYEKYLTAADIEKATGLKNIKLTESRASSSTGSLEFRDMEGSRVLTAKFYKVVNYKKEEEKKGGMVKGEIKGIGEDAYYGPNIDLPYILTFKKKEFCVVLATIINNDASGSKFVLFVSMEQLKAIAKIIDSRI
jgi:hypothetical protein